MDDFLRNPFTTLITDASIDNPEPRLSIDHDSAEPFDPTDEEIDEAAAFAAIEAACAPLSVVKSCGRMVDLEMDFDAE